VLESTVAALGVRGDALTAWLGPAISRHNFEVGDEVREAFVAHDPAATMAFEQNARGRWQSDLVALARRRLERLGITDVSGGQWCTFGDRERFFSHRRHGHAGTCGRMAALIWRV
jgi:copper oxidase (laccase) domain-containing protein